MTELAILIPSLGRSEKLAGLVENIHQATENPHEVYLIIEATDTISHDVAEATDAVIVSGTFGSCAKAVNAGYRASWQEFVAIGNDDCRFTDGWDMRALAHFDEDHHIVGLNDGSGDTKCFQVARRSFIVEHSGVFDKPNTLYHDGYQSQCVDTEFAHYAMLRGVWQDAHDAVLAHEHWRFGLADPDHENYRKARETNAADLEEYNRRRPLWDPGNVMPACVPGGVMA